MKVILCHICGEEKDERDFKSVPYFRKYKKRPVVWCTHCQKMYMEMKRERERQIKVLEEDESKFIVSFD